MSWRTHVSVLFLLAVSASVVAELTEYLQEIHVDITPSENVHDRSRHDSTRDTAADRHQKPTRRRRMLTDFDRRKIIDTLNRLRRSLGAPDMYYATWDRELEKTAAHLTLSCQLFRRAEMSLRAKYARGLTGYTQLHGIAGEIEKIYFQGSNSTFYWQIMASHLTYVGCEIGARPCDIGLPHQRPGHVFTCLFTYSRAVPRAKSSDLSSGSPVCSRCDQDAVWCDAGLCRTVCRSGDVGCVRDDRNGCETKCSSCDTAARGSHCQCVCYYADKQRRCTGKAAYATRSQPICRAAAAKDSLHSPAGFLSLTVCALLVFIIFVIAMACCITRCRSRKRSQRRSAGAARRVELDDAVTAADLATTSSSTYVIGASLPIILSPPLYADVEGGTDSRPPPYYQAAAVSWDSHGTALCSVDDLPSPVALPQPTAPAMYAGEQPTSDQTQAYQNAAFNDSGV